MHTRIDDKIRFQFRESICEHFANFIADRHLFFAVYTSETQIAEVGNWSARRLSRKPDDEPLKHRSPAPMEPPTRKLSGDSENFTKTPKPVSKTSGHSPSIRTFTQTVVVSLDETVTHDITFGKLVCNK
ncbi:hypothetical protein GWI33_008358 [Rhynchophorus ferrugineus]|uniref:Uncharacterized protein n=1 Tax=Rhynchophorus ferrugineus TaxID=354439 RepID=A0A834IU31_RHYFE|nr:hypothetical protein GWI33_008358 [Rhynchophorus ferrugineus]